MGAQPGLAQSVVSDVAERMLPEEADKKTFWEHVERYRFALEYVRGKRVLDIACGVGYGSAGMLKGGAASVVGVDIAHDAVAHAKSVYGVDARQGTAEAIPLPDGSVDVVVSFETVEHIREPERLAMEARRVLAPGGTFVVSTPNRDVYREGTPLNPHHHSEMTVPEFEAVLKRHFAKIRVFGQSPPLAAWKRAPVVNLAPRLLRHMLCPLIHGKLTREKRARIVDLINRSPTALENYMNIWSVRQMPPAELARTEYLVAVAQ